MNAKQLSVEKGISTQKLARPHVVIIGAGASLAAFPNGDRNGRRLPVIKNFVAVLGLANLLKKHGISPPYDDFEGIYSDIAANPGQTDLQKDIENIVNDYFCGLALPDEPTLYDHLILSLRPKDVIATFNWDPFLWQAASRNNNFGRSPTLLFLHGNVAIGYCPKCKWIFDKYRHCIKCGSGLAVSPLLYPVRQKDYQADDAIAGHWRTLRRALEKAWAVTFFGYGAPATDVEAVKLLKEGWGDVSDRNLEETEIIDIRDEDDLVATWSPFIHTHYYQIHRSFYDSTLARYPRRSCEALWARLMECQFLNGTVFPSNLSFNDLYAWLKPKLDEENR